jgi:SAM-dependent methyltransferase
MLLTSAMTVSSTAPRSPSVHETAYDPFASIYDQHMAVDFARQVVPVLERLLLRNLPVGSAVLDLCCGTGRVTHALVERGLRVTGVDASEPMLRLARRNAPGAQFMLADMRHISFSAAYPAVVSTFNSLAHVHTIADLVQVFRKVHAALVPAGALVFDLTMDEQYERCWRGSYSFAGEDAACTVRPSYDAEQRLARNDITLFKQFTEHATGADEHSLETTTQRLETRSFTIVQKCHTESDIHRALAAAGFERVESFDAEQDLGMSGESGRRFFRAHRG